VSSDFGQLVGMRHLISGIDCAIAGAAMVAAPAVAIPATLIKSRLFIEFPPLCDCCWSAFVSRLGPSMEHPVADFYGEPAYSDAKKPGLLSETGLPCAA
jgi:hypothetical protein